MRHYNYNSRGIMATQTSTQKRIESRSREEAYNTLFSNSSSDRDFHFGHDTRAFDELRSNYDSAPASNSDFESYTPITFTTTPIEFPQSILSQVQNSAKSDTEIETPEPQRETRGLFEPYLSGTDSVTNAQTRQSPQTFRPIIAPEIENAHRFTPTEMHQIAEVEVPKQSIQKAQVMQKQTSAITNTETHASIKLNTRGMIVVASFFAVLALITTLIIVNAVSLSASRTNLATMGNENSALRSQLRDRQDERDQVYRDVTEDIRNQLNNNGTFNGEQFDRLPPAQLLPPVSPWQHAPNPDASTNWFDRVSAWLSGLFR